MRSSTAVFPPAMPRHRSPWRPVIRPVLRSLPLSAALLLAMSMAHAEGGAPAPRPIANAAELVQQLAVGPAVTLTSIKRISGCGPKGCSVNVERVSVVRADDEKPGELQSSTGAKIRLVEHRPADGRELPDLDWSPLRAFEVHNGKQRWGSCLEFTHEGLGKSGVQQRWTSVVLVPFKGDRPGATAHRFVGYWAGCESLRGAEKAQAVTLPLVEPAAAGAAHPLHLMQYACTRESCTGREDPRPVKGDPGSTTGELMIGAAP
jgi:hypothetical protein